VEGVFKEFGDMQCGCVVDLTERENDTENKLPFNARFYRSVKRGRDENNDHASAAQFQDGQWRRAIKRTRQTAKLSFVEQETISEMITDFEGFPNATGIPVEENYMMEDV
jgi:hypothetical protein